MTAEEALSSEQRSVVRHRLANAFQLISALLRMRAQRCGDAETRRQLSWMLDVVHVLNATHQRRLGDEPDDLGRLIEELAPLWRRRCVGRPIVLDLKIDHISAREHVASAAALIAHELVGNAIAHAFPDNRAGCIRVRLEAAADGRGLLTVADDGVGYDPAKVDGGGFGLWLIKGLSQQAGGVMETVAGTGTTARLAFTP